ncbi:MAG: pantoate--beta-alanine ligase [Firmicutes bacterium]|nr:pantoate--beta-alanine ligase [Bacillota bacterium]
MIIAKTIDEARAQIRLWKAEGCTIGLCPTMGYLHEGHLSLMRASKRDNDKTVASVFVNPMQFGPAEDLAKYPRDLERDCALMDDEGVDMVFAPDPSEMYDDDFCSFVDMSVVSEGLCGKSRPVMFRGVCTVLTKLIHIISPDRMYMGKKDAQQLAVVRRMVRDLNFDLEVIGCPTVREEDGLAKSSRNSYLSPEERAAARVLSRALRMAQDAITAGQTSSAAVTAIIKTKLVNEPLADIDYVEIVDGLSMQPVDTLREGDLVAIAVRIGTTRLIDNFIVGDPLIGII